MINKILRADLHVHSKYSDRPSEWILKALGTRESYTEPEEIYRICKKNGMDIVTITDHNSIEGALILKRNHPEDVILGSELTTYFPENGCKIHCLVYGFTEEQFLEMDKLRKNIYELREYIVANNIAYSVAHATYSINGKLQYEQLERLMLLFNSFEAINGARNSKNNLIWSKSLSNLGPEHIERLQAKHKDIKPYGDNPWVKNCTAGSDDHAGIFIGKTYTEVPAIDADSFILALKNKKAKAAGRHSNFHSLAFAIYKIGYQFSKDKGFDVSKSMFMNMSEYLFEEKRLDLKQKFFVNRLKKKYKKRNEKTKEMLLNIVENNIKNSHLDMDEKLDNIYGEIAEIFDQFFASNVESFRKDIKKIDIINGFRKLSSSFVGIFFALPFLSTMKHFFQDRGLVERLESDFIPDTSSRDKKILWFTDTLIDLNGVSNTLRKIGWLSHNNKRDLHIVTCLLDSEKNSDLPPNVVYLPVVTDIVPVVYDQITIKFPSLLKSLKIIYELDPDEVIISTPGPVGLIGLLISRLMSLKVRAVFHTDFTKEAEKMIGSDNILSLIDMYLKWFYNYVDINMVPTNEYIVQLKARGFEEQKMELFRRGLDLDQYNYKKTGRKVLLDYFKLKDNPTLLFTGRVSQDKNLKFLIDVYCDCLKKEPSLNLIIAGMGPYYEVLKKECKHLPNVRLPGVISQKELPYIYSGADLFVFPSNTDTFGMSVLEAQACGLPALVSNIGGPQEIVIDNVTGHVIEADNHEAWVEAILYRVEQVKKNHKGNVEMKEASIKRAQDNYNWENLLDQFFKR